MTAAESETGDGMQWAAITGVIATVSVFAIAQGLSYPLLSFILQRQGVSPAMIGLSAAMTPIGFIVSSPLIPALARRFGAGRTALTCAALSAIVLALIGWTQNVYLWFPLRFLIGVVTNPLYVLSEIWVIALAPPARRGRIMGVYSTIISAGFAAGPLCLLAVGTQGWPPFLVGICAFVLCGICLASVLPRLPKVDEAGHQVSVLGFVPMAWLLLFAVIVAAGFEQGALALLPVYGTHHGIAEVRMSALLSMMIAGNIAMQVPLGLLAERLTARLVRLACVSLTALGCVLLADDFRLGRGFLRHLHDVDHRTRRALHRLYPGRRQRRLLADVGRWWHRGAAAGRDRHGHTGRQGPANRARAALPGAGGGERRWSREGLNALLRHRNS
jgi:MFS family permease